MTTELSPEWRTRAEAFLHQCGPCDAGLPMGCVCSTDDPRPVIAHLLDVIDTARGGVSVTDQTPTNTLTDAEAAYWSEKESGRCKNDRGGYYYDGFIDGFVAAREAHTNTPDAAPAPTEEDD